MPHEAINLEQIVSDALAGSSATRDELEASLVRAVEIIVGRRLAEYEKAKIGVELGCQWNAREQAMEDDAQRMIERQAERYLNGVS